MNKQLLDEVFCDIQNNQGPGRGYYIKTKPKAEEADAEEKKKRYIFTSTCMIASLISAYNACWTIFKVM